MPIWAACDCPACTVSTSTMTPWPAGDGLGGPVGRDHGDLVELVGVAERTQDVREHGLRQGLARPGAQ